MDETFQISTPETVTHADGIRRSNPSRNTTRQAATILIDRRLLGVKLKSCPSRTPPAPKAESMVVERAEGIHHGHHCV